MITLLLLTAAYQMAVIRATLEMCPCIAAFALTPTPASTHVAYGAFVTHLAPALPWPHDN